VTGPLEGIKVVEVGNAMAAPFCGMLLGDYGADVIKIERVGAGDDSRGWPPYFYGRLSHYYAAANRNKRCVALDLKSAAGVDIAKRLIARADVLLENYRVGALERAGLGYEAMADLNPRLIYCSVSGFGREGPRREERANDLMMQAFAGSMSVTGEYGGPPVRMGTSVADIGAGLFATVGILSALESRHRSGRGQHVTTSLLQGQLAVLSYQLTSYFATGVPPIAYGAGAGLGVPYGAFPTADDPIIIAAFNDTMWRRLCAVLSHPEWADDPRFVDSAHRVQHRDLLLGLVTEVLEAKPSAEWLAILQDAGVPCAPINRIDQVVVDPQVRSGGMIAEMDVPDVGPVSFAAPPIGLSETPGEITLPPPRLGEHTRPILRDLGFDDAEVDRLAADGVVGLDPT
jgi:crotonobetainyl-CoA:carnitine CoA-transferase CaiB-like acyl-CoA transferase